VLTHTFPNVSAIVIFYSKSCKVKTHRLTALSLEVIFRKRALLFEALLRKETCVLRHPLHLHHSLASRVLPKLNSQTSESLSFSIFNCVASRLLRIFTYHKLSKCLDEPPPPPRVPSCDYILARADRENKFYGTTRPQTVCVCVCVCVCVNVCVCQTVTLDRLHPCLCR